MFQTFTLDLLDDGGFDTVASLLKAAIATGLVEQVGDKTYKLDDLEFPKADWKAIVEDNFGGREAAYETWIKWCVKNGKLSEWENWNG